MSVTRWFKSDGSVSQRFRPAMNQITRIILAALFLNGTALSAVELLRNGGFEQPVTDELSQETVSGPRMNLSCVCKMKQERDIAVQGPQGQ